jgi:leader peptidase (prepilin peptidase)/N-methyltransferase
VNEFLTIPLVYRLAGLFALGAAAASGLNWAIYNLGWNRRAISPWSDAPDGAPPRQLWDLLPIVGWLFLRREAGLFGRGFWLRPMLIEVFVAALFAGLYWWEVDQLGLLTSPPPPPPIASASDLLLPRRLDIVREVPPDPRLMLALHVQFAAHLVLIMLMIVATFIDLDDQIIPDSVTMPGTLIALVLMAVFPWALLPDMGYQMPLGDQFVDFVTLTSPGEWPPWLNGLGDDLPLYIALACYLLWCFALLPRRWRGRRGWSTAVAVMASRIRREPFSWLVLVLAGLGSLWIWLIWKLGPPHWMGLLTSLVGLAASAGLVWGVRLIGAAVLRREAMGFGDVTLMAMIGAFLGWQAGVAVFFLAPFFALLYGLIRLIMHRESEIPYGPFLCAAALTILVAWRPAWGFLSTHVFIHGWLIPLVVVACMFLLAVLLALLQGAKALFRGDGRQPAEEPPSV